MENKISFIVMLVVVNLVFTRTYAQDIDGLTKSINALYNIYEKCDKSDDMYSCIKLKAIRFADRALKINNLQIVDGMTIVKNENVDESRGFTITEVDENKLPVDVEKRQQVLDDMLMERFSKFIKTHSVQLNIPKVLEDNNKSESFEGRGKLKKYAGPLLIGAMMKGGMMAYALKAVGLLAAKALMVSKIALVLASIIALKKLVGGGGGGGHHESKTIEIVQKPQVSHSHSYSSGHDFGGIGGGQGWESSGGGGGGGYGRSFDGAAPAPIQSTVSEDYQVPIGGAVEQVEDAAQRLAYRGRHLHQKS